MNEKDLKLTDLDYAIADHHMQMLKAALPYMKIAEQRSLSLFIKWNELIRTMHFFSENDDGMMSICSLDENHTSPADMLAAIKPYASVNEQDMIDFLSNIIQFRQTKENRPNFSMEQILSILPPEQQSRYETLQMVMQTLNQG
ncbi:MAG: hypothetical protein E7246_08130 [Lachnoclostridium sp.]|nr:hypothetical protein [Lachnoclostridium sp.]